MFSCHTNSPTSYKTHNFITWSAATATAWHPTKPIILSRDQLPQQRPDILQNPEFYHVISCHTNSLISYKTKNFITWSAATETAWHPKNPEFYHGISCHTNNLTSYKTQNFITCSPATATAWHPTKPRILSRDQLPRQQPDVLQNPEFYHVMSCHSNSPTSYKPQNFITWSAATATAWHPTKPRILSRDQLPHKQPDILQTPDFYHVIICHTNSVTSYKTQNFITWSAATATARHPTKPLVDPKQKTVHQISQVDTQRLQETSTWNTLRVWDTKKVVITPKNSI